MKSNIFLQHSPKLPRFLGQNLWKICMRLLWILNNISDQVQTIAARAVTPVAAYEKVPDQVCQIRAAQETPAERSHATKLRSVFYEIIAGLLPLSEYILISCSFCIYLLILRWGKYLLLDIMLIILCFFLNDLLYVWLSFC